MDANSRCEFRVQFAWNFKCEEGWEEFPSEISYCAKQALSILEWTQVREHRIEMASWGYSLSTVLRKLSETRMLRSTGLPGLKKPGTLFARCPQRNDTPAVQYRPSANQCLRDRIVALSDHASTLLRTGRRVVGYRYSQEREDTLPPAHDFTLVGAFQTITLPSTQQLVSKAQEACNS